MATAPQFTRPPAARGERLKLLGFLVRRVLAARVAELFELEATSGRLLVLGGGIIPFLAVRALKRNDFAH
jgi:hypothetical protein